MRTFYIAVKICLYKTLTYIMGFYVKMSKFSLDQFYYILLQNCSTVIYEFGVPWILVTAVVLVSSYYEWCVTSQTIKLQFFLNYISPGNTFYHTTAIISKELETFPILINPFSILLWCFVIRTITKTKTNLAGYWVWKSKRDIKTHQSSTPICTQSVLNK